MLKQESSMTKQRPYNLDDLVRLSSARDGTRFPRFRRLAGNGQDSVDLRALCRCVQDLVSLLTSKPHCFEPETAEDQDARRDLVTFINCFVGLSAAVLGPLEGVVDRGLATEVRSAGQALARLGLDGVRRARTRFDLKEALIPLTSLCCGADRSDATTKEDNRLAWSEALRVMAAAGRLPEPDAVCYVSGESDENVVPHPFASDVDQPDSSAPTVGRPQTDLTELLLSQLQTPVDSSSQWAVRPLGPDSSQITARQAAEAKETPSAAERRQRTRGQVGHFGHTLVSLNAGDILLEACCNLPELRVFFRVWEAAVGPDGQGRRDGLSSALADLEIPELHQELNALRTTLQNLAEEIDTVLKIMSLPLMEPLNDNRLREAVKVTMGCLIASLSVSAHLQKNPSVFGRTSSSSLANCELQDDVESKAIVVVEKTLELLNKVTAIFRTSTRAGGHALQNLIMIGARVLSAGLFAQTSDTSQVAAAVPASAASAAASSDQKMPTGGFSSLSVALSSQFLSSVSALLDDLTATDDADDEAGERSVSDEDKAIFSNLTRPLTATQRVAFVTGSAPFVQGLFNIAVQSYQKACVLSNNIAAAEESDKKTKRGKSSCSQQLPVSAAEAGACSSVPVDEALRTEDTVAAIAVSDDDNESFFFDTDEDSGGEIDEGVNEVRNNGEGDAADLVDETEDEADNEGDNNNDDDDDDEDDENEDDDDDDDDDDSEPLLGKWFEETLFPPEKEANSKPTRSSEVVVAESTRQRDEDVSVDSGNRLVPRRGDPAGFIALASQVFDFMSKYMLAVGSNVIKRRIASDLDEPTVTSLAWILRDLECRCDPPHYHPFKANQRQRSSSLNRSAKHTRAIFWDFSVSLTAFVHNLIALGSFPFKLQVRLLSQLSICPWDIDCDGRGDEARSKKGRQQAWPLRVPARNLAILGQILLLNQNCPSEGAGPREATLKQGNIYNVVWTKFLRSVTDRAMMMSTTTTTTMQGQEEAAASFDEDVNVEHLQLLLVLFHALPLMTKKQILLTTVDCISKVAVIVRQGAVLRYSQVMHISRLVLVFEYFVRNLYEPPKVLFNMVQENVFKKYLQKSNGPSPPCAVSYYEFPDIKVGSNQHHLPPSSNPTFYNLFFASSAMTYGQESPRPDGLACSFILSNEAVSYNDLYQSLVVILGIASQAKHCQPQDLLAACQYCFTLTWRLLQCIPPSAKIMETMLEDDSEVGEDLDAKGELDVSGLLLKLMLRPRLMKTVYSIWVRDCLVKQGLEVQQAKAQVQKVGLAANQRLTCDVKQLKKLLKSYLRSEERTKFLVIAGRGEIVPEKDLPTIFDLLVFDVVVEKIHISLDSMFSKLDSGAESSNARPASPLTTATPLSAAARAVERLLDVSEQLPNAVDAMQELVPLIVQLVESFLVCAKSLVLHSCKSDPSQKNYGDKPASTRALEIKAKSRLLHCLSVSGGQCPHTKDLSGKLTSAFPKELKKRVEEWNECSIADFPPARAWRNYFDSSSAPSEIYLLPVINVQVSSISASHGSIERSLKHCLHSASNLACDIFGWCATDVGTSSSSPSGIQSDLIPALFPLLLDGCAESLAESVSETLEKTLGKPDSDDFLGKVDDYVLSHLCRHLHEGHSILSQLERDDNEEKTLLTAVEFMEATLDSKIGRSSMANFFIKNLDCNLGLVPMLMNSKSSSSPPSKEYMKKILSFFNKVFAVAENHANEWPTKLLCNSLVRITDSSKIDEVALSWLREAVLGTGMFGGVDCGEVKKECRQLLHTLINYIANEENCASEEVALAILDSLVPLGSQVLSPVADALAFADFLAILITLANTGSGKGHIQLFKGCAEWINACIHYVVQKNVIEKLESGIQGGRHMIVVENACEILKYMHEVVMAAKCSSETKGGFGSGGTLGENDQQLQGGRGGEYDEWMLMDDQNENDEDSAAEESDEDSFDNMLCTFTQTEREFISQHWYHCHTCKMVGGVGVCTVCAKVCHANHDLTYSKYGSFFCDCGAKEDRSCMAMAKRPTGGARASGGLLGDPRSVENNPRVFRSSRDQHGAAQGGGDSLPIHLQAQNQQLPPRHGDRRYFRSKNSSSGANTDKDDKATLPRSLDSNKTPPLPDAAHPQALGKTAKKLAAWKDVLLEEITSKKVVQGMIELHETLVPVVTTLGKEREAHLSLSRLKEALVRLHGMERIPCEYNEQLMLPTLGSQEGAFENVRMNFSGDQGQTIRQLLNSHIVRRVVMCCVASSSVVPSSLTSTSSQSNGTSKRQYLAVAHEKGKIAILQLSSLLKQADSNQKKLTLSRLASAPVPFTVLSINANPANEDYLAVSGIKDCHVLVFNSNGSVADHLALHPQLDANNFIIKTVWVPGSQTELALVTADFVKIYDLGKDILSPEFYLLMPRGKVRDCTLAYLEDGSCHVLIMSSAGHVYFQKLCPLFSASNGPFYVTSILEIDHPLLQKDPSSVHILGGGVSIFYNHPLKSLFVSYVKGKSFMVPLPEMKETVDKAFPIVVSQPSGSAGGSSGSAPPPSTTGGRSQSTFNNGSIGNGQQPLCQWGSVSGHPGMITAFFQGSNNPVVIAVKPDMIQVQELKVNSKAKVTDMVAIRHASCSAQWGHGQRTTMILLCEDGSLKIYTSNPEVPFEFWMPGPLSHHRMFNIAHSKPPRRKKGLAATGQGMLAGGVASGQPHPEAVMFPVDFFEHCHLMTDAIEFGGNDVLQIYNVQQLKTRLQSASMYIANTKPGGFQLEVTNNDPNQVMVGIRVMLGSQDYTRVPSFFEVFGRGLPIVNLTGSRWYEFPFTREESMQADKKITITFGPSVDSVDVSIIDSVQVYGKTKESFGWPEDAEELQGIGGGTLLGSQQPAPTSPSFSSPFEVLKPSSPVDNLMATTLDILEGCLTVDPDNLDKHKGKLLKNSSRLLTVLLQPGLDQANRALLTSLFPCKQAFNNHRDEVVLSSIMETFEAFKSGGKDGVIDIDSFQTMVAVARDVAVARPSNLVKFAVSSKEDSDNFYLLHNLIEGFWQLLENQPVNHLVGTVGQSVFSHLEATVQALVEICHAFTSVNRDVELASKVYLRFLTAERVEVSFSAKQALVRVLKSKERRVRKPLPSPPMANRVVGEDDQASNKAGLPEPPAQARRIFRRFADPLDPEGNSAQEDHLQASSPAAAVSAAFGLGPGGIGLGGVAGNLGVLLPAMDNIPPPVLDIPGGGEVDDDAMMELAIALSLQDSMNPDGQMENIEQGLQRLQQGLQQLGNLGPGLEGFPGLQGLAGMLAGNAGVFAGEIVPEVVVADEDEDEDDIAENQQEEQQQEQQLEEQLMPDVEAAAAAGNDQSRFSDTTASGPPSDDDGSTAAEVETDHQPQSSMDHHQPSSLDENKVGFSNENPMRQPGKLTTSDSAAVIMAVEVEAYNAKLHSLRMELLDKLLIYVPELRRVGGGGVRCIPFMQILLLLSSDLTGKSERDRNLLNRMLDALLTELNLGDPSSDADDESQRSDLRELQLVILRLFSVLMSRSKAWQHPTTASSSSNVPSGSVEEVSTLQEHPASAGEAQYISQTTASALVDAGVMKRCLSQLRGLLGFWKSKTSTEDDGSSPVKMSSSLLRTKPEHAPPEMSPFFLKQYVRSHAHDVFEAYPQLLTEMALRLPYQARKILASESVDDFVRSEETEAWYNVLCEYMMTNQTPYVRRQARKLLLYMCGSKEKYRELRDFHTIRCQLNAIEQILNEHRRNKGSLLFEEDFQHPESSMPYDALLSLIEHLKTCGEIASGRTQNWQKFCAVKDTATTQNLFYWSYELDDSVSQIILDLLLAAIRPSVSSGHAGGRGLGAIRLNNSSSGNKGSSNVAGPGLKSSKRGEKPKGHHSQPQFEKSLAPTDYQGALLGMLNQLVLAKDGKCFSKFVRRFLLECNSTAIRWQAHELIVTHLKSANPLTQSSALDTFWNLWPQLPRYGAKAAQFVDILGYFSLKTSQDEKKMASYVQEAMGVLKFQNDILANHPNANLYNNLAHLVQLNGYFLESDPCLVCNNPEVSYSSLKLSNLKVDTKFTTTTQIVKLAAGHSISKITLRIGDLKRQKMVRTINIYYNNKSVQAVVELKNKPPKWWHKAKKVTLAAGQTDIKIEFPLPIVACNLMIEYADFFENIQASSETLQCPRCSTSVPANPGVCSNCGENVFQCHKCRSINYDEKDPFLCNTCGFCKYAKFEYTLTTCPCCAVDPIENEDDRKKAILSIDALLDKADKVYKQLIQNKPYLESLLAKVSETPDGPFTSVDEALGLLAGQIQYAHSSVAKPGAGAPVGNGGGVAAGGSGSGQVNYHIQQLAIKYCGDCKNSFEELSRIIQRVMAFRKELVIYDQANKMKASSKFSDGSWTSGFSRKPKDPIIATHSEKNVVTKCYGCASASVEHCLTLLRALATKPASRQELCGQGLIQELMDHNLRRGAVQIRQEVRKLICLLTKDNPQATAHLNDLLFDKIGLALRGHSRHADLVESVRHEMILLTATLSKEDSCWEQRLRCVLKLFLMANQEGKSTPAVMECITLPCLKIINELVNPVAVRPSLGKQPPHLPSLVFTPPYHQWHKGQQRSSGIPWEEEPVAERSTRFESDLNMMPSLDVEKWIECDPTHSFEVWQTRRRSSQHTKKVTGAVVEGQEDINNERADVAAPGYTSSKVVKEKYFRRWRLMAATMKRSQSGGTGEFSVDPSWLRRIIFNKSSRNARQVACDMIESFCKDFERKKEIINLLTGYLGSLSSAEGGGEPAEEFVALYKRLIASDHWKYYLAVKGVLFEIANLITAEIEVLNKLEKVSLNSDLALGYALKTLTDIFASFVTVREVKAAYKGRLVSTVLQGYLSLRRLVVQRTKLVDLTQEKLLELLEEMTTGTEEESKKFMAVCVNTINRYPDDDHLTPVFILERLCNMIYPEEADTGEFFLALEKDSQQEDFLQGRMLGNPYSSNEPGLGPLMRHIKNKICTDCELIALLEDDNGMELLVNNKIISLDLPVKDVYQKVWLQEAQEGETMRIIYRMRGLLGDATEEFVEALDKKDDDDMDEEEVFRLANVMAECGGLDVILNKLNFVAGYTLPSSTQLLSVLLKLFGYCIRVKANRDKLIDPKFMTVPTLIRNLKMCLETNAALVTTAPSSAATPASGCSLDTVTAITEQILEVMEKLLAGAASSKEEGSLERYCLFASNSVTNDDIRSLLGYAVNLKVGTALHQRLLRVLPFLTFGSREKMSMIIVHFEDVLDFEAFDVEHTQDDEAKMEAFVALCNGIERNEIGNTMKAHLVDILVVKKCLDYLMKNAPKAKSVLVKADDPFWKEFVAKPSLRHILRALAGLAAKHPPTQLAISQTCIPILHQMEQMSSDEHVGSMAEWVLEAIRGHPDVDAKVQLAREETKTEKKKLAMAMRRKQLQEIGLETNERGQVKAENTSRFQQFTSLGDEHGLYCNICREGYKFQPSKVLAIYTYTRPCCIDEFENSSVSSSSSAAAPPGPPLGSSPSAAAAAAAAAAMASVAARKPMAYTTVTHFNLVHVDCHMAAVRQQRGRDEWESAMLQNANTRCNGLLPLWGPQVSEPSFASCLAKHNTFLMEATRHRDIGYISTIHDLKFLLLRFAQDKSFSQESGGGGPQSNMHLVPYIMQMALYVMNTTRSISRVEKNLMTYLDLPQEKWLDCCYAADGPHYQTVLALLILSPKRWRKDRVKFLQRLLLCAHAKSVNLNRCPSLAGNIEVKEYAVYKPVILFFALVDQLYAQVFHNTPCASESDWSVSLGEWIRNNDETLLKSTSRVLATFQEDLLPATSVDEIVDVCGLIEDIPSPASFLLEILTAVP